MTLSPTPSRPDLDLAGIRLDLDIAETTRSRQLANLPSRPADVVAVMHRERVEGLLMEIRDAISRLDAGRYGWCIVCGEALPATRLEMRPWTATCSPCGRRTSKEAAG